MHSSLMNNIELFSSVVGGYFALASVFSLQVIMIGLVNYFINQFKRFASADTRFPTLSFIAVKTVP